MTRKWLDMKELEKLTLETRAGAGVAGKSDALPFEFRVIKSGMPGSNPVSDSKHERAYLDRLRTMAVLNAIACSGCKSRCTGLSESEVVVPGTTNKDRAEAIAALNARSCMLCVEATAEIADYAARFFRELELENYPTDVLAMYRKFPLWKKYRLRGFPDSAVRVLALKHTLPNVLLQHFQTPGRAFDIDDVIHWLRTYLLHVLCHLPADLITCQRQPCAKSEKSERVSSVAQMIVDYADPSMYHFLATRVDETYKWSRQSNGLTIMPSVTPDALEQVDGWTHPAIQHLCRIPAHVAVHFCAPLGYQTILDKHIPRT